MINASAYLCLFDDFDLLGPALETIVDRVDEIVVVDGAYRWMLPYFTKMKSMMYCRSLDRRSNL
jgi:hypothetical protein